MIKISYPNESNHSAAYHKHSNFISLPYTMPEESFLENPPANPSGWETTVKSWLGLMVWFFIAFLTFIILILVWGVIEQAITMGSDNGSIANPILPLVLIIIAFVAIVVGMTLIAGIFNLLYSNTYYDMGKMFSLTLLINVMLFMMFIPLYIMFAWQANTLFFVLAFHVIFAVFVSYTAMECSTNPNYAAVHLIGTSLWMTLSLMLFGVIYRVSNLNMSNSVQILISVPPLLAYFFMPLFHNLWQMLYYKLYSMGNNFFYIPSLSEVMVDANEDDDIAVDTEL